MFYVICPNQNVPVHLDKFWAPSISKTAFQAFCVEWLTSNYNGKKPLHLGIQPKSWCMSAGHVHHFPLLHCTHEEADDRIMFHIQVILSDRTSPTSVTVFSADTDVFICLLYHLSIKMWVVRNSGVKRSVLPVHDICTSLDDKLVQCLLAIHALTGWDSTSKISMKLFSFQHDSYTWKHSTDTKFWLPTTDRARHANGRIVLGKMFKSFCRTRNIQ